MNDNQPPKNWIDRLSDALLREPKDREQLVALLNQAHDRALLDDDAFDMIEGVLQVSNMQVRDVMVPRPQMITIDGNLTTEQALPTIIAATHSRFPVTGDNRDQIIGILLAKDLLPIMIDAQRQHLPIREITRPATFIPENKRLDILLSEFRQKRHHMAIVVDEYGGIAGLVTIENVLEEIVGEIEDEYDTTEEPSIREINPHEFMVDALTPINELNQYFDTDFSDENCDTISGLVLQKFNHLPKPGETTTLEPFTITVVTATNRGIQLLRLTKDETPNNDDPTD